MLRILLTAFEPYEPWTANASWLALVELTREMPTSTSVATRLYPVELQAMKTRLATDLKSEYDVVFHLGQAPHSSCIQLEEVALNVSCPGHAFADNESPEPVCESGPAAYRTALPVHEYAQAIRAAGIPARVSHHAGTYLCNAIFYWSCRLVDDLQLRTKTTFVHIPLATSQVLELDQPAPFMPTPMVADAVRILLDLCTSQDIAASVQPTGHKS